MTAVDHCLPPTTNTLDPLQRQRLLKSTQKVGALLGATPRVLERGIDTPQVVHPSTMRTQRRQGGVFYNQAPSASSSETSLSSDTSDRHVWISSSKPVLASDNHGHHKHPSMPITVHFPGKSSAFHRTQTKTSPSLILTPQKPLSQPILYRMRSKPSPPPIISPLTSPSPPSASMSPKCTFPSTGSTRRKGDLTESDRRRKMAKLVRTLGENIPPELVFGDASSSTIFHPPQRSTSLRKRSNTTVAQPLSGRNHQRPQSKSDEINDVVVDPPIVFRVTKTVEACSLPIPTSNSTSTSSSSSTSISASTSTASIATITHPPNPRLRKHRPRSLTLGSIPFKSNQGNIVIEQGDDVTYTPRKNRSFDIPSSTSAYDMGDSTTTVSVEENKLNTVEYGKRKEKEWSGEWNVKDMRQVAQALRGLRRR